jgi:hypothetical protein
LAVIAVVSSVIGLLADINAFHSLSRRISDIGQRGACEPPGDG